MLQTLGPLGSVPSILLGLLALAAVILVGRFVLHIAWKLVLVALVVVGVLWLLGMAGAPLTVAV
jgi:fatty acid desaturase